MSTEFTRQDMEANKVKAGLGYFIFFLPLILCKDSRLGRHCANQGLLLLIASIVLSAAVGLFAGIPLLGWLAALAGRLVRLALFLIALMCFLQLNTNERAPEIPLIGSIRVFS